MITEKRYVHIPLEFGVANAYLKEGSQQKELISNGFDFLIGGVNSGNFMTPYDNSKLKI